jgi:hypothetical protein
MEEGTRPLDRSGGAPDDVNPGGGSVAVKAAEVFHSDPGSTLKEIEAMLASLAGAGFPLTPVRVLEILVWTQTEKNGYDRSIG